MLPDNSNECPLGNRNHIGSVACVVAAAGLISTGINKGFVGWLDNPKKISRTLRL
jgi:hypothetical protein